MRLRYPRSAAWQVRGQRVGTEVPRYPAVIWSTICEKWRLVVVSAIFHDPRPYLQIAAYLRAEIEGGALRPGQPVPSIEVLRGRFGYSRSTVGKGLRVLEREGVLCRVRGLGYHVPSPSLGPLVVPLRSR
jgi:hypothetical protein